MPYVEITWFTGRTYEVKQEIAKAIIKIISEKAGIPEQAFTVVFHDIPKEDWNIGGKPGPETK